MDWKALDKLTFGKYRLRYHINRPFEVPVYLGSVLRGKFGARFRRMVCSGGSYQGPCRECICKGNCPYAKIFESYVPAGSARLRTHQDVPRPFVIEPPLSTQRKFNQGEALEFHLILFGWAVQYLPYFIVAFRGIEWIGRDPAHSGVAPHGSLELAQVILVDEIKGCEYPLWSSVNPNRMAEGELLSGGDLMASFPAGSVNKMTIEFQTMTRLKAQDVYADAPEFHILIRNLLRRVSNLVYFYAGTDLDLDFRALIGTATSINLARNDTRWVDWERYSYRQERSMNLGGITGVARYAGTLEPFLHLLRLGEYTHVGKGATFGLGKYTIRFDI